MAQMTSELWALLKDARDPAWTPYQRTIITIELDRARSAEERLTEDLRAKDGGLAVLQRQVELISHVLGIQQWSSVLARLPAEYRSAHLLKIPGAVLAKKDEAIKALADALEAERGLTGSACMCITTPGAEYRCVSCKTEDALRLAGRRP